MYAKKSTANKATLGISENVCSLVNTVPENQAWYVF